jgi:hypothetical protein
MVYQWKPEARISLDAQVVGERLEHLRVANGGRPVTPERVVDDARPEDSPLHEAFEWDDSAAAEEWRKEQARYIIRHVQVVLEEPTVQTRVVRAFVNVVDREEQGYTSIQAAMAEPELRRQVVARAFGELQEWRKRYRDLRELADVFEAVDRTDLGALL